MISKDAVIIERMTQTHLEAVSGIEKVCFSHPWSYKSLSSELEKDDAYFFVALTGASKVIGYIGLNIVLDEGYLANIAVLPGYRRQGVAKKLFKCLFDLAKEKSLSFITLEVRESNSNSIKLYDSLGFTQVGRRKAYYSAPLEDAVLMTKYFEVDI